MDEFEGHPNSSEGDKDEEEDERVYDIIFSSFWKRLGAWIIDQILLGLGTVILLYLTGGEFYPSAEISLTAAQNLTEIFILVNLAYFAISEGLTNQTIGKRILGISVYEEEGTGVSFTSAIFRRIGLLIPVFGLIDGGAILITSKNQRIFDLIAGTVVIEEEWKTEALKHLRGVNITEELEEKGILKKTPDKGENKEEKILEKIKNMKSDLKNRFGDGEIDEKRYHDLMRKYESRIDQLEKKIGNNQTKN